MLSIEDLSYAIEGRPLFEGASARIPTGHKVGLVGANGTGKTTLFRLIRGEVVPDGGSISLPSRARIGAVAQEVAGGPEPILDLVLGADAERAALLCKCDLLSAMVGEFPELQGIMGAYYALADGENPEVAAAVREHYQPRGAGDALPGTLTGAAVALADKLDTLAGIFAIGQKPSGTKDPFALRRAAIGVLRIILESRFDLDLGELVAQAVKLQPVQQAGCAEEVLSYILERLRAHYQEAGVASEIFDAVLATGSRRPLDFDARVNAVAAFRSLPEAESLAAANKRIANILKKSAAEAATSVDVSLLQVDAERALHAALVGVSAGVEADLGSRRYNAALTTLAGLRPAIDAFFNDVMVNDPDPALRANRLALVGRVRELFSGVADLSRLPG